MTDQPGSVVPKRTCGCLMIGMMTLPGHLSPPPRAAGRGTGPLRRQRRHDAGLHTRRGSLGRVSLTGCAARGHSIRVVRTVIEATVLGTGFLLGGTVGIGILVYAVSIGPLAHVFIPLLASGSRPAPGSTKLDDSD